jgi:integrase
MLLVSVIKKYLDYVEVSLSNGTYRFDLSHSNCLIDSFQLISLRKVKELSRQKIYDLYYLWKNRGVCESTINKRISLLKRILNYSGIFIKGVSDFPTIKFKHKSFKVIPKDDLIKLIHYFNNQEDFPVGLTRKLIFYLLFYTGCRVNELIHIEILNIDLNSCSILLEHTKNGKPRIVFYDQFLDIILKNYIDIEPQRKYLFKDYRLQNDFNINIVESVLRYACKKLMIRRVSPHMFRHTFATIMIENGCSLVALQYILGHSNPMQTEKYMHLGRTYLKKNFDDHKPKI